MRQHHREGGKSDFYVTSITSVFDPSTGGPDDFALYDVTGDGIPELHTSGLFYDIFAYLDGELIHLYGSPGNRMNGPTDLLENGAILNKHVSTGEFYHYTTFDIDGTATEIYFTRTNWDDDNVQYGIESEAVTKEEWDALTKDIFALEKVNLKGYSWDGVRE